jgi:hypothetical protein
MTVLMPKFTRALVTAAAAGAALFTVASPAHADTVKQNCVDLAGGRLCVSYNYTSRTAAANAQRKGSTVSVDLALNRGGGTVLISGHKTLSNGQWYGIYKTGVAYANYCAYSAYIGGQVCLG